MERIIDDLSSLATPMDTLLLDPANARTGHDIDAICASLTKFGQRTPLVVNKNTNIILKGNGTYKAAKQLGWDKIAASYVNDDNLTATQYSIADNRTGDLSVFDDATLKDLLNAMDEPLDVPGIDEKFLNEITYQHDEPPSLDDLEEQYGEPNDEDFYPILKIKVTPEAKKIFEDLMQSATGEKEHEKFDILINAIDRVRVA